MRLSVDDHEQVLVAGIGNDITQRHHAGRTQLLEEGRLRFDDRHERSDDVNHAPAERGISRGRSGVVMRLDAVLQVAR